jgi:ABC-2 type transport system ATP-binding protein
LSIEARGLTKIYGENVALDQLSFQVESGGVVGLLGPNGAGKSTCMRILTGYSAPTEGDALINDVSILAHPVSVRQSIGYLPENNPLYEEQYVDEYLSFSARIYGLKSSYRKQRIREMIALTGLEPERRKPIGDLSKGYRQRVGLAQALIHDPDVLILDEPTSGLDPNQVEEIRNLIRQIGEEKTVILSSHIMQEVQAMCSRVLILREGRLVVDEDTQNLVDRMAGGLTMRVRFKRSIPVEELKQLQGVSDVHQEDNYYLIDVKGQDEVAFAEEVFQLAQQENNPIIEMQKSQETLEHVFQELTQ